MTVSVEVRALDLPGPDRTTRPRHAGRQLPGFRWRRIHYSKEWDDAPMPAFRSSFTKRVHAIHGSFDTRSARRAGVGALRKAASDNAKQLFRSGERARLAQRTVCDLG